MAAYTQDTFLDWIASLHLLAVQQTDSRGSLVQQDLGMFAVTLSARFVQAQCHLQRVHFLEQIRYAKFAKFP